ncbi:hypothetical protein F4778DRAFT_681762 [Xylariomycetidae sp. FL2044]|nr:hypothetical protein F4778DRAFT_681762 [Xylariomycetidae sp. FL2044]
MKFSLAIFALAAVASAELTKVPRAQKAAQPLRIRQAADSPQVQTGAMSSADGTVVPFNTAGVYKAASDTGL